MSTPGAAPLGPRRSQRVFQQPERVLSSVKVSTPNYAAAGKYPAGNAPPAPNNPVPAHPQASFSTYSSRLKTGATLLMQPVAASFATTVVAAVSTNLMGPPKRRGGIVNYAEGASEDEFGIDSEDDEEFQNQGPRVAGKRGTPRPGLNSVRFGSPGGSRLSEVRPDLDKSYLGEMPPSRFIASKPYTARHRNEMPSNAQTSHIAKLKEVLIPVRVDLDTETHRIRDCFTWNLNEEVLTPEAFARIFCQDLDLPIVPYADQVSGAIRAQLEEHAGVATYELEADHDGNQSSYEEEGSVDTDALDHPRPGTSVALPKQNRPPSPPDVEDGEAHQAHEQVDCRVLLSIDVQINKLHLLDTIEWDLSSSVVASAPPIPQTLAIDTYTGSHAKPIPSVVTPESFARSLCTDLGLHGEAIPLLAHAIHEEILKHKKDAIEWGVFSKEKISARQRARNPFGPGPRPLRGVWRDWNEVADFTPRLEMLSQEELERRELERERIARRLRRDTSKYVKTVGRKRR